MKKERALYLPRAAQRQAAETLLALLGHALRAIPDRLELVGAPSVAARAAAEQIEAALEHVAAGLMGAFAPNGRIRQSR